MSDRTQDRPQPFNFCGVCHAHEGAPHEPWCPSRGITSPPNWQTVEIENLKKQLAREQAAGKQMEDAIHWIVTWMFIGCDDYGDRLVFNRLNAALAAAKQAREGGGSHG